MPLQERVVHLRQILKFAWDDRQRMLLLKAPRPSSHMKQMAAEWLAAITLELHRNCKRAV